MHRIKKMVPQLVLLAVLTGLSACDEYCDQGTTSAMVMALRIEKVNENQEVLDETLVLSQNEFMVSGEGVPADPTRLTFYNRQGIWLLPLSNSSDTTCYLFKVKDSPLYRIRIVATRSAKLISEACGCATVASIRSAEIARVDDPEVEPAWTVKRYELSDAEVRVLTFSDNYRYVPNIKICF